MKTFSKIFSGLMLAAFAAQISIAQTPKTAAPKISVAPPARSTFNQPANPKEGRDPFFPESTHPYEAAIAAQTVTTTTLTVKGYSIANGRPIVIINNHSFMVGDEGDVLTAGGRAHLHCLEIRNDTVIVEINGIRHEIHF